MFLGEIINNDNNLLPYNKDFTLIGTKSKKTITCKNIVESHDAPLYFLNKDDNIVLWNSTDPFKRSVLIRDVEFKENERKTQIKLIRKDKIEHIVKMFQYEMERMNK
jgi:hypothetical protein